LRKSCNRRGNPKKDGGNVKNHVPRAQGCYSQGDAYLEAAESIKDAIKRHIEDHLADGEEIPQVSVSLSIVEIAV